MAWVGESVSLAAIGEYCLVMDCGDRDAAQTRGMMGRVEEFGRRQVEEAKKVLGMVGEKDEGGDLKPDGSGIVD